MIPAALPWHEDQWRRVAAMAAGGRLPHALLLRGVHGTGKARFAQRLAAGLLCTAPVAGGPCGRCRSCRLAAGGAHPDLSPVSPLPERRSIVVEQIREVIAFSGLTRSVAPRSVVVLSPATAMTRSAANTLLKTLEEPPGASVFLLLAERGALLPATVRSRCQGLSFPVPRAGSAVQWLAGEAGCPAEEARLLLALARGAPLGALELHAAGALEERARVLAELRALVLEDADPVAVAARWKSLGLRGALYWIHLHAADLVRLKAHPQPPGLANLDMRKPLKRVAEALDLRRLYGLLDRCVEAGRALETQLNLNEQLLLEGMAVAWRRAGVRG